MRGTWVVLEACRRQDAARGGRGRLRQGLRGPRQLPYREDSPLLARFPYDASKAAADLIARSYWHTYGLPVATTRFANLYGGGRHNGSRLVPEAVGAALAGRAPVIRSDGTPERDFLYVEDAAAAYLAIARALDGERRPWRGLQRRQRPAPRGARGSRPDLPDRRHRCASPDIRGKGTPPGEIDRQYVDTAKLRELTGWAPRCGLEEGLSAR